RPCWREIRSHCRCPARRDWPARCEQIQIRATGSAPTERSDRREHELSDHCAAEQEAPARSPRSSSPDRWGILNSALGPEPVEPTADPEIGAGAHVAVEYLAVVADLLDDPHHPVLGQPELLAEIALNSQEPPDFRLIRFQSLVHRFG